MNSRLHVHTSVGMRLLRCRIAPLDGKLLLREEVVTGLSLKIPSLDKTLYISTACS